MFLNAFYRFSYVHINFFFFSFFLFLLSSLLYDKCFLVFFSRVVRENIVFTSRSSNGVDFCMTYKFFSSLSSNIRDKICCIEKTEQTTKKKFLLQKKHSNAKVLWFQIWTHLSHFTLDLTDAFGSFCRFKTSSSMPKTERTTFRFRFIRMTFFDRRSN